ncbi:MULTISPECIES: molybdopterin-dependent oxidoreductase [unclassified Candidatus Frackibacter]|uniref:molybdopterin-dependent oxidoreductase n=1 Tax=unclassified Candidatus Frackibacter TaxID=2648818 RepID=UPI00079B943A|nr:MULTISPECIES: molybdopterin-dependent oxidoreductase [unclassified Candidatus Frackibacter]KXS39609.1 MAG: anaerobic dehydrogenase [Candidatus Frackibacter sp. T328-2]SDC56668.1 molybdopterin guanine dinucleotide-containing S/N-oxide reductases [Candidatus Frackibacter sp. WG11]SEM70934.1 molybdopterin guanine dinucleotide-containing S/N-oxide reductases [Candidatus Frackibacter sp. WG12]SFL83417.1 molybdopterin guanine dinucleotide-containing S/N-oxide reductases [Candidatus Frackibacter sp
MTDKNSKGFSKAFSRRNFLKGAIGVGAVAGLSSLMPIDLGKKTVKAGTDYNLGYDVFRNACPRNCYDTCGILSYVKDGVLEKVDGDPKHGFTQGKLCVKGYTYAHRVYSPDRIKYPMIQEPRGSGNWRRISWDKAMDIIAKKVLEIKEEYGSTLPIAMDKYSGNFGILHYVVEGMMSSIGYTTRSLGTPCWPAGIDSQNFDMGAIYNSDPEDMANSDLIIIWGANPAWCSIHTMPFIQEAKENGAKVVVIDPIQTQTASKADTWLQIKTGTDGALALAMAKYILDNDYIDKKYIEENVVGFKEFADYLRKEVSISWAAEKTGLPEKVIIQLAKDYATTAKANIWAGYGLQRHINGGQTVRAIDALGAITGKIGKPGAGVQYAHLETWGFNYNAMVQSPPSGSVGVENPDGSMSNRTVNINNFGAEVLAADDPPIKMLWIACRNTIDQHPDVETSKRAFDAMDLVVTVDQFMNETVKHSDIVLPCTTLFEHPDVNASYWHYWVNINEQAIDPLYEAKSDLEIAMALSRKMNELEPGSCTFPTDISQEEWLAKEFNDGIYDMLGIKDYNELRKGPKKANLPTQSWSDGNFRTPSGKYELYSKTATKYGHPAIPSYKKEAKASVKYPVRLLTPHWKYGLHSQFQNLDWMMNMDSEPEIEIHPDLAQKKRIKEGDLIKLSNELGKIKAKAKLTGTVPKDAVVAYEAWYKDSNYSVNDIVKATPSDMGEHATGSPGLAFHDNFVKVEKV